MEVRGIEALRPLINLVDHRIAPCAGALAALLAGEMILTADEWALSALSGLLSVIVIVFVIIIVFVVIIHRFNLQTFGEIFYALIRTYLFCQ